MQIKFASVTVDDQEKALSFYTNILGFVKMAGAWFTVRVNTWVVTLDAALPALIVNLYTPPVPAAGLPLSRAPCTTCRRSGINGFSGGRPARSRIAGGSKQGGVLKWKWTPHQCLPP